MEPSNQTNGQPFIYRIMDALGVNHQVVPVNHTHSELVGQTVSIVINGNEIELTLDELPNILRAISDPDSAPKANSNKLVTSGGVKAALDGKQDALTFDSTPTAGSTNPVTSGGVKAAIDNIINPSSRQIILTKTADGYQFASAESELAEFVNRITSWTGESVPTIITCVVITNDGTEGMPAILTYSSTSRYIDFRINIATYRLEGQIMIDEETYSSDMLMELTDMSYVFAE